MTGFEQVLLFSGCLAIGILFGTPFYNKGKKKYIKGARLWLYPKGIRLYRKSKGIKKPTRIKMTYAEARAIIGVEPHYRKKIPIEIDDFQNTIIYEQFNRRRKKEPF